MVFFSEALLKPEKFNIRNHTPLMKMFGPFQSSWFRMTWKQTRRQWDTEVSLTWFYCIKILKLYPLGYSGNNVIITHIIYSVPTPNQNGNRKNRICCITQISTNRRTGNAPNWNFQRFYNQGIIWKFTTKLHF